MTNQNQDTPKGHMAELSQDLPASIVVFLVALPLCIGIANASMSALDAPPIGLGLISGIIGGLIVGALAGSPLQVSGPAAGLVVLVADVIQKFGLKGLGVIVLIAGVLQVVAGLLRVGRWFRAVSPAVIHGMLAGIGVLIFASQFHMMVDDKPGKSGLYNLFTIPRALYKGIFPMDGNSHHLAAYIGVTTILLLVFWNFVRTRAAESEGAAKRVTKILPAPLIAIVGAVIVTAIFSLGARIEMLKVAPLLDSINSPFYRDGSWTAGFLVMLKNKEVWVAGFAMAVVASAESLLCASAVDQIHQGARTNYDKELAAQGVGNIIAGVLGALPITGVIVRSSANVEAGGVSRKSAILHGVWLLVFIVLLPFVLSWIPRASLAAVLVYIGYKLINFKQMSALWHRDRSEFAIYMITLVMIVSADLLSGVIIGVVLSLMKIVYTFSHLTVDVEQREEENRYDVYVGGSATFVRLPMLAETLESLPLDAELHIHLGGLTYADHACVELLSNWSKQLESGGGELVIEWDDLHTRSQGKPLINNEGDAGAKAPSS